MDLIKDKGVEKAADKKEKTSLQVANYVASASTLCMSAYLRAVSRYIFSIGAADLGKNGFEGYLLVWQCWKCWG